MGAQNSEANNNPIDNYQTLRIKESLTTPSQYSYACKELSFILKNAYSRFPKNLQLLVFQETLFAFSVLPEIPTHSAISAANSLLQSAEYALPKQKRALAVKGYKHAVVATRRKSKLNQEEEGCTLLPQDVLVHIFSFLDAQSLVSASAVCWSWNATASDDHLWKLLYDIFFSNSDIVTKRNGITNLGVTRDDGKIDWRCAFKTSYKETCYGKFKSYRGYCLRCCSIVWISSNQCSNKLSIKDGSNHQIKPISTQQIVDFILEGWPLLESESSSDSDSDTEDASIFKLWAYPRMIG